MLRAPLLSIAILTAACASPDPAGSTSAAAGKALGAEPARKDEAELVTGSRIPVRGSQPVRTIDKEEITRNSGVIGVPAKGN